MRTFSDVTESPNSAEFAHAALRRLNAIVDAAPEAIIVIDGAGIVQSVNPATVAMFRYTVEELVGKDVAILMPAAHGDAHPSYLGAYQQGGSAGIIGVGRELTARRKDGSIFPIDLTIAEWPDPRGAKFFTGTIRDITKRKRAEEALRESETRLREVNERFEAALDASPVVVMSQDEQLRYAWIHNPALGYRPEDVVGKTDQEIFERTPDGQRIDDIKRAVIGTGIARREEVPILHEGVERWYDLNVKPQRRGDRVTGIIATAVDITDRKHAEEDLRERDMRLRQAADLARLTYFTLDYARGVLRTADNFASVVGYEPPKSENGEASMEENLRMLRARLAPGEREQFDRDLRSSEGSPVRKIQYRLVGDDGAERWIEGVWSVEYGAQGAPVRAFGTNLDVTERKLAEQEIARIRRMEVVGRLAGGIAHDFNNLLAVIAGNLEIAQRAADRDPERMKRGIARAMQAVDAGASFNQRVRRMLSLAGDPNSSPEHLALGDQIQETAKLLESLLGEPIALTTKIAPDLWPTFVDAGEIDSALFNLALNARDAMANGGSLVIEARNATIAAGARDGMGPLRGGDYVELSVSDSGAGMAPDVLQRAGQPFFSTKGSRKGTGLGLSGIIEFARKSGGFTKIESEPGKGTRVSIYLPRVAPIASRPLEFVAEEPCPLGNGEFVLVVEDDPQLREVSLARLEGLGYAVVEAKSALAAIEILTRDSGFDLVFSDIIMPGMNGYELARWVAAHRPRIKVLLASGYNPGDVRRDAGDALASVPVLDKPYSRSQLAIAMRRAMAPPNFATGGDLPLSGYEA